MKIKSILFCSLILRVILIISFSDTYAQKPPQKDYPIQPVNLQR